MLPLIVDPSNRPGYIHWAGLYRQELYAHGGGRAKYAFGTDRVQMVRCLMHFHKIRGGLPPGENEEKNCAEDRR